MMRDALARAMYDRQADTFDADPGLRELAWADPDIRAFWEAEADHVLAVIGIIRCGGCLGKGSHQRHCPKNPTYSRARELADRAEDIGDSIGGNDPVAANHCYAAAGLLRAQVQPQTGES